MDPMLLPFDPIQVGFSQVTPTHFKLGDFGLYRLIGNDWRYAMGMGIHPKLRLATFGDALQLFRAREVTAVLPYYEKMIREYKINSLLHV